MTRVIKNKVVVPRDYVSIPLRSAHAKLTRSDITRHDIVYDSSNGEVIYPFDRVYEREFVYDAQNEHIEFTAGTVPDPGPADYLDYDIEIKINNNMSRKYRFFRFIIRPNINVTSNKLINLSLLLTIINPKFQQNVNNRVALNSNSPTDPPYIYWSDGSGYAFLYDAQTHEIWNDTENGTEYWGEPTAATISEDEPSEAAEIRPGIGPGIGGGVVVKPDLSGVLEGAKINKAIVPQDYARLIHTITGARIISTSSVTHNLTTIDVSSLPNYDMVGEIKCEYSTGSQIKKISVVQGLTHYISRRFELSSELVNKYRLIRFIVKPNINNISVSLSLTTGSTELTPIYFRVYCAIDGTLYGAQNVLIVNILPNTFSSSGQLVNMGSKEYAFIFDTKTKEFYDDTANGTGLWSDIYKKMAEVSPL